jgi:hypothetical protein
MEVGGTVANRRDPRAVIDNLNAPSCDDLLSLGARNMTKISSSATFFNKRVFPTIWFGFLAFFFTVSLVSGATRGSWMFIIVPIGMALFGYFLMKRVVWDLADEVFDGGDFLLVRNRGIEDRVPLTNIMNVSASTNMNPQRITLRLVEKGRFGQEIAFSPISVFTLNPFAKNRVAEDLIVRVDQARSRRVR